MSKRPKQRPTQLSLPVEEPTGGHVSVLRPGWLVGLATNVRGNVNLEKEVLEAPHIVRGKEVSVVQTKRIVHDPEEHKKANQARMKARAAICSVCAKCDFGLICPDGEMPKLNVAISEARRIADTFNRTARLTTVEVHVVYGRVAQDDVQAVRAIKSELRSLIGEMTQGVKDANVQRIRKAANDFKSVSLTLSPRAAEQAKVALEAARAAARKIVKAGESAAIEIDRDALRVLKTARAAFLDADDGAEVAAPVATGRAVEYDAEAEEGDETPPEETVAEPETRRTKGGAKVTPKPGKAPKKAPKRASAEAAGAGA